MKPTRTRIWFFSVNDVDKDTARIIRFKEKLGISFPVLLNRDDNLVYRIAGSNAYPLFAIIEAKTGIVRFFYKGYSEDLEDILKQAIIENL